MKNTTLIRHLSLLFLLLLIPLCTFAQSISVKGFVKDANGEFLPGVNVVEVGTSNGTATDMSGKYELKVSARSTLRFSFVGYQTSEINVNGRAVIDISLKEDVQLLDELVVVGYGVQKKSDITGSITSVDVSKIRDVPSSSISKMLQGKTAGLEIQNMSTRPGGDTRIRIRGERSLSASNDPLIVVDGIPFGGSLNDISSDDIGSIEILKDASATVIYGSRGANGVIIITTKRGKSGDVKISYNGYQGITNVSRKYEVFNAEEFVNLRTNSGWNDYLPDEKESMLLGRETNWQDLAYKSGITSNHQLTISGGTNASQYSLSGGYYDETGILPGMGYQRFNLRFALDQQIGKYIKVGMTSMESYGITDGQSASPMWALVSLSPLATPYNLDGTLNEQPVYPSYEAYNPLTLLDESRWKEQNRRMTSFNSFYGEVNLYDGLKYRLNVGLDFSDSKYGNYYGSNTPFKDGGQNTAQVQNSDNLSYTLEHLLTYDKTFAQKHRLGVTAMYSVQQSTSTSSRFDATDVAADYLQYNNLFLADVVKASSSNNYYSQWGLISYMGRINYAYDDRYLVTVTGRSDGSSRLAPGNQWHSYPAGAFGWNIINEEFMKSQDIVTNLKLRVGYGQTSNTSINPYTTLGGLSGTVYNFGSTGVKGYYVSTLPNSQLGWEFTTSTNIGLDFAFLNGRISGAIDVYKQETNGLLLGKRLPPPQGVPGSYMQNIGSTENKGLEFILNGSILRPQKKDGFAWDVSANIFLNRSEITALQDTSITQDIGNGWFVGSPTSAIYDYVKIGIWQLGEEADAASYGCEPGDMKLLDFAGATDEDGKVIGDGKITDADRRVLGSSEPDFQGGFSSYWTYKGFDLSVVTYFRVGGMIASTVHMPNAYFNRLDGRRNNFKVDYWTPTNPTNDMPKADASIDANRTSVLGYFDGSFLKIRSINFGYNFPEKITNHISKGLDLRLYGSLTDPFIFFSPYVDAGGVDPEPTGTGPGMETITLPSRTLTVALTTPPTQKFIIGINVNF